MDFDFEGLLHDSVFILSQGQSVGLKPKRSPGEWPASARLASRGILAHRLASRWPPLPLVSNSATARGSTRMKRTAGTAPGPAPVEDQQPESVVGRDAVGQFQETVRRTTLPCILPNRLHVDPGRQHFADDQCTNCVWQYDVAEHDATVPSKILPPLIFSVGPLTSQCLESIYGRLPCAVKYLCA